MSNVMYKIESIENQRKGILPMNDISATIFYNQRFIISAPIPEPLCWRLTKVEDVSPCGVRRLTFAQDIWDQHKDFIEIDEMGNVIGMYADYFESNVLPDEYSPIPTPSSITSRITVSGKPQFKIGGSAKTFTVTYYDNENQEMTGHRPGSWALSIDGTSVPNNIVELTPSDDGVKLKVKFLGDDTYIGKILTVTNTSDDATAEIQMEIIAL